MTTATIPSTPMSKKRPQSSGRSRPSKKIQDLDSLSRQIRVETDSLRCDLEDDKGLTDDEDEDISAAKADLRSKKELSDKELDDIEEALALIDAKRKEPEPSEALRTESRIALYGERHDRNELLYSPQDAVQRKWRGEKTRFSVRIKRRKTADGKIRKFEQTIYQDPMGKLEVIDEQEIEEVVEDEDA